MIARTVYLALYGLCCALEMLAQWGKELLIARIKAPQEQPK